MKHRESLFTLAEKYMEYYTIDENGKAVFDRDRKAIVMVPRKHGMTLLAGYRRELWRIENGQKERA